MSVLASGLIVSGVTAGIAFYNYDQMRRQQPPRNMLMANAGVLGLSAFLLGSTLTRGMSGGFSSILFMLMLFTAVNAAMSLRTMISIVDDKDASQVKMTNLIIGAVGATGVLLSGIGVFAGGKKAADTVSQILPDPDIE